MDCDIQPLERELFERAEALGIGKIILNFSGGSDEGYLNVDLIPKESGDNIHGLSQLCSDIEEWGLDVYDYSGAGDGNEYGDDVEYDLVEKTVTTSEWWMTREYGENSECDLVVGDGDVDDEAEAIEKWEEFCEGDEEKLQQ